MNESKDENEYVCNNCGSAFNKKDGYVLDPCWDAPGLPVVLCSSCKKPQTKKQQDDKPSKRYWYNCVEQFVLNLDYHGYRSLRIEVFDREKEDGYSLYEIQCMVPEELFDQFYDMWDWKESDVPLSIDTPSGIVKGFVDDRKEKEKQNEIG